MRSSRSEKAAPGRRSATPHIQRLQYGIFVGVDKSLAKHVDWRIVEVSYGSVDTISSQTFGGPTPIPAARVLGFSTGFVFRFK
jgi:hypothetical protein